MKQNLHGARVFKSDNNLDVTQRVEDGITFLIKGNTRDHIIKAKNKALEIGTYYYEAYLEYKDEILKVLCVPK